MKAMLLAAGRGKRLGNLTADLPKPLLKVGNKSLIEYHLDALAKAGIKEIVINVAYHGKKIISALGTGERYGVSIHYSYEPEEGGLETGGGIFQALPLLGAEPFLVVNSDIWTDFPFDKLPKQLSGLAHIVLVDNPDFKQGGDFHLAGNNIENEGPHKLTYSGIAVYRPEFFEGCVRGRFSVTPFLRQAADRQQLTGEHYQGQWFDIGTPERLAMVRQFNA